MTTDDRITFAAAFPAIQFGDRIYGDKQGMRIQLDIPRSETCCKEYCCGASEIAVDNGG